MTLPLSERWLYAKRARRRLASAVAAPYGAATALRRIGYARGWLTSQTAPVSVVSVGSPLIGGGGKTPAVLLCAQILGELGAPSVIVSRGYGRTQQAPVLLSVDDRATAWEAVGDEPAMLLEQLRRAGRHDVRLAIGADRHAALTQSLTRFPGTRLALLDDGLQHLALHRDLDLVLLSKDVEDCAPFPLGALREPLRRLPQGAIFWHHCGDGSAPSREVSGIPCEIGSHYEVGELRQVWPEARDPTVEALSDRTIARRPVVLASAVGRNQNVRILAERHGLEVVHHLALRDHAAFGDEALRALSASGLPLVTTEKDLPRLLPRLQATDYPSTVATLGVAMVLDWGADALRDALKGLI
ncbi:MAG: tetraacyldisaccharide 4'-kinase [Deltaproteobacteria bacterium CG2_30_63_29]|nr:MAG: tetraacyldisaccharide 4'-kinase [Deltaproteobacteria bacterium CG2_30_63_29]PJB35019.1 MAG: tetraacyldisaccharide 4'-kinase [Deltaproteobacteria bacterium CG_4_9_14_3_um_filter_63_12]